jgi:hypothetical protein
MGLIARLAGHIPIVSSEARQMPAHIHAFLTLREAAQELKMSSKTLARWLNAFPADPPLFARPGRDYIISREDVGRIYDALKSRDKTRPQVAPRDPFASRLTHPKRKSSRN